jgi:hypothetical protein
MSTALIESGKVNGNSFRVRRPALMRFKDLRGKRLIEKLRKELPVSYFSSFIHPRRE